MTPFDMKDKYYVWLLLNPPPDEYGSAGLLRVLCGGPWALDYAKRQVREHCEEFHKKAVDSLPSLKHQPDFDLLPLWDTIVQHASSLRNYTFRLVSVEQLLDSAKPDIEARLKEDRDGTPFFDWA